MDFQDIKDWYAPNENNIPSAIFKVTDVVDGDDRIIWIKKRADYADEPICFTRSDLKFYDDKVLKIKNETSNAVTFSYRVLYSDGTFSVWSTTVIAVGDTLNLSFEGTIKIYLKHTNNISDGRLVTNDPNPDYPGTYSYNSVKISTTIPTYMSGNILSLICGDSFSTATSMPEYAFTNIGFNGVENVELVTFPDFVSVGCYSRMFMGNTDLVIGPRLPAANISSTNSTNCYREMFIGCQNLKYIECTATSINVTNTYGWLENVAINGTFVKAAGVEWPRTVSGIPSSWTVVKEL